MTLDDLSKPFYSTTVHLYFLTKDLLIFEAEESFAGTFNSCTETIRFLAPPN